MIAPRRFLPSISALMALEAVDRLGSATAAAKELSLTQSAVSRQLQSIEAQLDAPMFQRQGRAISLTPAAREYVAQVRGFLTQLANASVKLRTNPTGGNLNLAILPAFGVHWLAPRLADFARRHPEVTVNLSTRLRPFDFRQEPFDAAIHFGRENWPGVSYLPIMSEQVVAVSRPGAIPSGLSSPAELLAYPLLHIETRPNAWRDWFRHQGVDADVPAGMSFDQFSTIAQAAAHGLGIALLPTFLVQRDLEEGRLVVVFGKSSLSVGKYYLVWPADKANQPPLVSFRNWLEGTTEFH